MTEQKLEANFFMTVFVGVLVLTGYIFYQFVGAITLALVLAILLMPLYDRIRAKVKSTRVSAGIVVLITALAILLPASILAFLLLQEVRGITHYFASIDPTGLPGIVGAYWQKMVQSIPALATLDINALVRSGLESLGAQATIFVTGTLSTVLSTFVALFTLYFFLKDGKKFLRATIAFSPLNDIQDEQIVHKLRIVSNALIRGTLLVALVQGILTGFGLWVFGVSNPVLFGAIASISALIPAIGTGLVSVPALIYLLVTGQYVAAAGFAAWGFVVVGLSDNLLRPYLIGHRGRIHPLFVLLTVLGGVIVFGIVGILLGPLIFGLLIALSEIYKVKIQQMHDAAGA